MRFQAKMDDQALTNAYLSQDSALHDRIMNMPRDEFESEFADVLNANAYDDWDEEEREGAGETAEAADAGGGDDPGTDDRDA